MKRRVIKLFDRPDVVGQSRGEGRVRFEIWRSANRQFYWVIIGGNGEVMAQSETMIAKSSRQSAIASVKANAASAAVTDKT